MVAPPYSIEHMSIPAWLRGMLKDGRYRSTYDMSFQWKIPEPTISRWLNDRRAPSVFYCVKLAEVTGTPVEEVVRMANARGTQDNAA